MSRVEYEDPVTQAGFAQIPIVVLTRRDISNGAKLVYGYLGHVAWRANGDPYTDAEPPRKVVAEALGMTEKTVTKHMAELCKAPVLEGDSDPQAKTLVKAIRRGQGLTNSYLIRLPEVPPEEGKSRGVESTHQEETKVPFPLSSLEEYEEETNVSITNTSLFDPSKPPRLKKQDGQDLAMNTLADVCGIQHPDRGMGRALGVALNGKRGKDALMGIREQFWRECLDHGEGERAKDRFEPWLAKRIRERYEMLRAKKPWLTVTPFVLAQEWSEIPTMPDHAGVMGRDPVYAGLSKPDMNDGYDANAVADRLDQIVREAEEQERRLQSGG